MFPWQETLQLMIKGVVAVYFEPIFWMMVAVIAYQFWQLQKSQKNMFGICAFSLTRQVVRAVLLGSLGGVLGSFLLILVGANISQLGFTYIWPVAMILMLINLRFLCFAYAGGIVALSSALFGWPVVDVPQVLVLVAILHVTESILIAISGNYSSMPIILRHDDGRLVGAFNLQNFWPMPLVVMAAIALPESNIPQASMSMPDWWPLLPVTAQIQEGHKWLYVLIPIVAALGYTDIAVASSPQMRRRTSALYLAGYSIILLALALLSVHFKWLQIIAALVSPLGHEFLIRLDNKREMDGIPRYVPPAEGLMVLDTVPHTPARKVIKIGDILLKIQGLPINNKNQLAEAVAAAPVEFKMEILREGKILTRHGRFYEEKMLGVILVPEGDEEYYIEMSKDNFWVREWIKRKFGKHE